MAPMPYPWYYVGQLSVALGVMAQLSAPHPSVRWPMARPLRGNAANRRRAPHQWQRASPAHVKAANPTFNQFRSCQHPKHPNTPTPHPPPTPPVGTPATLTRKLPKNTPKNTQKITHTTKTKYQLPHIPPEPSFDVPPNHSTFLSSSPIFFTLTYPELNHFTSRLAPTAAMIVLSFSELSSRSHRVSCDRCTLSTRKNFSILNNPDNRREGPVL